MNNQGKYLVSRNKEEFTNIEHFDGGFHQYVGAEIRFKNHHGKYIMAHSNGDLWTGGAGAWEIWKVVHGGGDTYAFWNPTHKKFMRMNGGDMDLSSHRDNASLPSNWAWERFKVEDGGNGTFGLWNPAHKRWASANPNGHMYGHHHGDHNYFPSAWTWQRYKVEIVKGPNPIKYRASGIHDGNHWLPALHSYSGWSAKSNARTQWLNMTFPKKYVTNVLTQGRANADQWVTKYDLYYKNAANQWKHLGTKNANNNRNSIVKHAINQTTHEVQINVHSYHGHVSMRAGVEFGSHVAAKVATVSATATANAGKTASESKGAGKKCLILDQPINKEICFTIPDPVKIVEPIINKVKDEIKQIPNKVKKDVVDPAINGIKKDVIEPAISGVKNLINNIKNELKGLINKIKDEIVKVVKKLEEFMKKVGEQILKTITTVLIAVVKALLAIFKPIFGIGKVVAWEVWKKVTKIAPFLSYLPYLIVIALTTPIIFFPVIVICLVLSAFTGPYIFLLLPVILIGIPYFMINKAKQSIEDLKNFNIEKFISDIFSNMPKLLEGIFKFIKDIIEGIVKKFK